MTFTCPSVRTIKSGFEFTNVGRIAKIRGIACVRFLSRGHDTWS